MAEESYANGNEEGQKGKGGSSSHEIHVICCWIRELGPGMLDHQLRANSFVHSVTLVRRN